MQPAGDLIDRTWRPGDEQYRADLYRQLVMNIGYAYFQYFQSDATHPDFMPIWNSVFMLQPNPDDVYLYAPLQGDLGYRIIGDRGSIYRISFTIGHQLIGMSDTPQAGLDFYELEDSVVGPGGRIEIVFSAERPAGYTGYWRYLDPRADYLIIRQRSYDWGNEVDSRFAIECIDPPGLKRMLSAADIARLLAQLVKVPERWTAFWLDWQNTVLETLGRNKFEINKHFTSWGGVANQAYLQAMLELAPGEALILETELPQVRSYWNFQMNDPIFNALEFVYRQTSINGHTAHIDQDGRFRAVVSAQDPGVPNWLDTGGYEQASIIGRWQGCSSAPVPTLKKVPFGELRQHLPAGTPQVSPDERAQAMQARRRGAQLRRRW